MYEYALYFKFQAVETLFRKGSKNILRKNGVKVMSATELISDSAEGILLESMLEGYAEYYSAELSVQIMKEKIARPTLTKDQIVFWFHRFRKLNTKKLEHCRRLIDSFVNVIVLYDDRITFTFNYKDGTKTITFAELEESGLCSDINALAASYCNSILTNTINQL